MEERILAALDELSTRGTWLAFVMAVALVAGWFWFKAQLGRLRSYHDEKGKNLATKEDVAELTRLAEEVRHEFEELREANSQKNRLQLAALDKRLEAHQSAFRVWHLFSKACGATEAGKAGAVNDDEVRAARAAWDELWERQSLYLDAETRAAIHSLPKLHRDRRSRIEKHQGRAPSWAPSSSLSYEDRQLNASVEASMLQSTLQLVDAEIRKVLALIEQGVHLPPLSEESASQQSAPSTGR